MKIVRVQSKSGAVVMGELHDDNSVTEITGDIFGEYGSTETAVEVERLLAPLDPPNVLGIGANYKRHIEECGATMPGHPMLFVKPTTSLIGPGDPIRIPAVAPDEVDFEAELAIVIGKKARNVAIGQAKDYILGYTCANDVSARDVQLRHDLQWARGKSFDTFCPLGPCITTGLDPTNLAIGSRLNGETMQESNTGDMLFPAYEIVSFLSHSITLLPGTVIVTGTPEGVGIGRTPPIYMKAGDTIEVEIEGIGVLSNPVAGA